MDSFGDFFDAVKTTFSSGLGAVADVYRAKSQAQVGISTAKLNKARIDAATTIELQRLAAAKAAATPRPFVLQAPSPAATPAPMFAITGLDSVTPTVWIGLSLAAVFLLTRNN